MGSRALLPQKVIIGIQPCATSVLWTTSEHLRAMDKKHSAGQGSQTQPKSRRLYLRPMSASAPVLPRVPVTAARRLFLAAQGLTGRPLLATTARLYDLIHRLGFVQIDSINIVERAHHLILSSRLRGYRPSLL